MNPGFDFDAAVQAPFRMQPGLRRLAAGAVQLTPLAPGSRHQREKLAVLSVGADEALQQIDGFDPRPALRALCEHAAREHPQHFTFEGASAASPALGVAVEVTQGTVDALQAGAFGLGDELPRCLRTLPVHWRVAGLLALTFAEDAAIVDGTKATVPWLAVCLPSHWAPKAKVGLHFAAIHAPVADNALLLQAGEALLRLACNTERWERFVWNVTDHPRLNQHPRACADEPWAEALDGADLGALAHFRSERQTFLPVPEYRQAVFTIAVDVEPLARVAATAARAQQLHDAIASMSPAVLAYRRLDRVRAPLLAWLAQRAAG